MRTAAPVLALFLVVGLTFAGCQPQVPEPDANSTATNSTAVAETPAEVGAADVNLEILTFDEIQQRIADKQGRVVVVDAWSTSCPPCMKDFHNLVELHKQHKSEDVACVSLSFDFEGIGTPEEAKPPVLEFLKSQGATFDNLMSSEESDVLYRKLKLNAVPAVFVYDRTGKLRERFEGEGAYEKVRALVAELVKEPAVSAGEAPVETPAD